MNLYHLRYFSTLAHIEHYTKAADILAITQPSLSYAISTLEEELGVKLFEKNGRNVTLTKYGKVFLNDVEEVLNRLDSSVNSLKLAGKGEGCIDVAFLRTLGIDFLPKIKLEIAVSDELCDKVVESIASAANTGRIGDGKIFVMDLEHVMRIRTGETDDAAV